MTIEEKLERPIHIVEPLAGSVVAHDSQIEAHDNQIENLIRIGEAHDRRLHELTQAVANLEEQWRAYINTLPRQ